MRIVNRKTFLSLPAATLFYKFSPFVVEGSMSIKGETLKEADDFLYTPLDCFVDPVELADVDIINGDRNFVATFNDSEQRDGAFKEDQLFMVFESVDLANLITVIGDARAVACHYKL